MKTSYTVCNILLLLTLIALVELSLSPHVVGYRSYLLSLTIYDLIATLLVFSLSFQEIGRRAYRKSSFFSGAIVKATKGDKKDFIKVLSAIKSLIVIFAIFWLVDNVVQRLVKAWVDVDASNLVRELQGLKAGELEIVRQGQGFFSKYFRVVVLAPVVEELIFREGIFKIANSRLRLGPYLSLFLSTVVFAFAHFPRIHGGSFEDLIIYTLPFFLSGTVLCLIYIKYGLLAAIIFSYGY